MKKLINEFEIALLFCGDGENENSVKAILEVNKQFIEKAKLLLDKEKHKVSECDKCKRENARKADEININLISNYGYFEVNSNYKFNDVEKAKSFYEKLRKESGFN